VGAQIEGLDRLGGQALGADLLAGGFQLDDLVVQPLGEVARQAFQRGFGLGDGRHVDPAATAYLELEHVRHLNHFRGGLVGHGRFPLGIGLKCRIKALTLDETPVSPLTNGR
jgi:hypothetical protein